MQLKSKSPENVRVNLEPDSTVENDDEFNVVSFTYTFDDISNDNDSNEEFCDDDDDLLYQNCSVSTKKAMVDLFLLQMKHKRTKRDLKDELKFLNKILPPFHNLPKTPFKFYKYFEDYSSNIDAEHHFYCSNCLTHKNSKHENCISCKSANSGVFFAFSLSNMIKYLFKEQNLAEAIDKNDSEQQKKGTTDFISDIQDSSEFKKLKQRYNGRYDVILMWSTDGVRLDYKSSSVSYWPIQITVLNVLPVDRLKFTMTVAVWCDSKKPKMNVFMAESYGITLR